MTLGLLRHYPTLLSYGGVCKSRGVSPSQAAGVFEARSMSPGQTARRNMRIYVAITIFSESADEWVGKIFRQDDRFRGEAYDNMLILGRMPSVALPESSF